MVGWHTSRPLINFGQSVGFGQPSAKTRAKPKSRSRLHVVPVHPAPRPVRSRSPRSDRALPALRRDAPSRVSCGPARLPVWRDEDHRREALVRLDADIYSASNSGPHAATLNTIELALSEWCFTLWPPTTEKLRALATSLKEGGGLQECQVILDHLSCRSRTSWLCSSSIFCSSRDGFGALSSSWAWRSGSRTTSST